MSRFAERAGQPLHDYPLLHQWSVDQPEAFWPLVVDFCEIVFHAKGDQVLMDGDRMPGARWFPGSRLNFAENLLVRNDEAPAIIYRNESGAARELSFSELRDEVAQVAAGLRAAGVQAGDRVAGFLPNCPEAVVAMLATTSMGAVWSSCSPDFGVNGVLDRFGQIKPRILFTADGYWYGGKMFDCLPTAAAVATDIDSNRK